MDRRVAVVALLLAGAGCKKKIAAPPPEDAPAEEAPPSAWKGRTERVEAITGLLAKSESGTRAKYHEAATAIGEAADLTVAEGLALIAAVANAPPLVDDDLDRVPPHWILSLVAAQPHREFLEPLRQLAAKPGAVRASALVAIAAIDSPFAAAEIVRDLKKYPDAAARSFERLQRAPHQADALFPRMFELTDDSRLEASIYTTADAFCDAGKLQARHLAGQRDKVFARLDATLQALGTAGRPALNDAEYFDTRFFAGELIRLLACMPSIEVDARLIVLTRHPDAKVAMLAALSLVQHGSPVDRAVLERIAAATDLRGVLLTQLRDMKEPALFPAKYLTQELLAQSDLAYTLDYSDFGRPPEQLVLAKRIAHDDGDYYVYKFRAAGYQKGAWFAGVAGPFHPRADQIETDGAATGSNLELWSAHPTAEAHLAAFLSERD